MPEQRGLIGNDVIQSIKEFRKLGNIDPVLVAEKKDGKLTLTIEDPMFWELGDLLWDAGVEFSTSEKDK